MASVRAGPEPEHEASDSESVMALLSPSDGYFRAQVPDEMHIPDPEQRNTPADKEREARESQFQHSGSSRLPEAAQARPASRRSTHSALSARSSIVAVDEAGERSPLLSYAPPAYSDIARDTNISPRPLNEYGTMGREESFFPTGRPQNLGGADHHHLENSHPQRPRPSWRSYLSDVNKVGKLLALICIVILLLGFLVSTIKGIVAKKNPPSMPDPNVPGAPSNAPAYQWPASCRQATLQRSDSFTFSDPQSFSLAQRLQRGYGRSRRPVQIEGQVLVQMSPDQDQDVRVDIEYRSNVQEILDQISLVHPEHNAEHGSQLELWLPESVDRRDYNGDSPCLAVAATVSLRAGISFDQVSISVLRLQVVFDGVAYAASSTIVQTETASVRFRNSLGVDSREIRITSGTGSVDGSYPLLDLLSIESTTGSVDVLVHAREADKHKRPASLLVFTRTGSVTLSAPQDDLPERTYRTSIGTNTGSIVISSLMHGQKTDIKSGTGSIEAKLHPVGTLDDVSTIDAHTTTGTVEVVVSPHGKHPDRAMRKLSGTYSSTHGSVELTHPLQWEGHVRARSQTGSIDVKWPGLSGFGSEVGGDKGIPGFFFPGSRFEGRRGKGDAQISAESRTGSIQLSGRDR